MKNLVKRFGNQLKIFVIGLIVVIMVASMVMPAFAASDGKWKKNQTETGRIVWWYQLPDGSFPTSTWYDIDGIKYHFGNNGFMNANEWAVTDDGKLELFDANGMVVKGWYQTGNSWMYSDGTGKAPLGWKFINNKYYYFDGSNKMVTGWLQLDNDWFLLSESGNMITGWTKDPKNGNQYYLDNSGKLVTGEKYINGTKYLFDFVDGHLVK